MNALLIGRGSRKGRAMDKALCYGALGIGAGWAGNSTAGRSALPQPATASEKHASKLKYFFNIGYGAATESPSLMPPREFNTAGEISFARE